MRRLNVKLTLWLIGITLFSVIGVHFLHGYQIDRNADVLKVKAEKARDSGDLREAMNQYNQYLKHRDDSEGYSALATIVVEIAKDPEATVKDRRRAYSILEEAIRRHPDLDDVRLSLIEYTMQMRRYGDALEHIQYLADKGKKGTDLDLKIARCHFENGDEDKSLKVLQELIGYDGQTGQFADQPPPGATEVGAFELLARILRRKSDGLDKAGAAMTQLVAWNPDSSKAHLARARFLITSGFKIDSPEYKQAEPELERSLALDPDDPDGLLMMAMYRASQGAFAMSQINAAKADGETEKAEALTAESKSQFEKAQELLDKALKAHPERPDVYLQLAQLAYLQADPKKAAAHLQAGLTKATEVNAIIEQLIDLQLQTKDLDAVRATCKIMRDKGTFPSEIIRFQEARLKFAEGNFLEASREFESVAPALARYRNSVYSQQLDVLLGQCYETLNQPDRQLEVYRRILQSSPSSGAARLGEATALQSLGRYAEAAISLDLLTANAQLFPVLQAPLLYLLINDQLQKPAEERDWKNVDSIAELLYARKGRTELENATLQAELLMLKDKPAEAQQLLLATRKKYPKEARVWMTLAKLLSSDPKRRENLPVLLDRAEEQLGNIAAIHAERIKIAAGSGDNAAAELAKLEKGVEKFTEDEQVPLRLTLGMAYLQIRDYANAKKCWNFVISKDPKNAQLRQVLFELAVDNKDTQGMQAIVKELHDSRNFGPSSPLYKYCAASALVWQYNNDNQGKKGPVPPSQKKLLTDARKLVDEGIAVRAEWSVLWRVRAEIDQLEGNIASAIENYQRSLEFSRTGQATTARRLVQLLYATNRIQEASDALKYVGGSTGSSETFGRVVEDILAQTGDVDKALALAEKDVETDPKNPVNHIWLGQLLARVLRADEAEQSFRKAVEARPDMVEGWDLLVRHLMANKKKNEAVEVVRNASEPLAKNALALATLYERVGDNERAEHYLQTGLEEHPNDLPVLRRMVDHYVNSGQSDKAVPYLDKIIEMTSKSTDKLELGNLAWARRNKANILASAGDYEHIVEATKLIESNTGADGRLSSDDTTVLVNMLSGRPEFESREKAARLLAKIQESRPLVPREQVALGQLYDRAGKWDQARDLMLAALSRKTDDPEMLVSFANALIRHGDYDDATRWVERLEDITKPPAQVSDTVRPAVRELRARLLIHAGQTAQAVSTLASLVPSPLPQNQLHRLEIVARMMESLGLNDGAESLLTEYMSQESRGTIAMAAFLGRKGEVEKAYAMLEDARKSQPMIQILPVALEALRKHPDQATKERFELLEKWTKSALETEANSQRIKLLLAEQYDLQGRYKEVIEIYRQMLADKDTDKFQKAIVKNNLAFVLAITKTQPDSAKEALKIVDEAIKVLGPTSDLLDTRALAYISLGNTKSALADLKASIADAPSASKYFHLALAEKQANNVQAAGDALAKVQEAGDDVVKAFTPAEGKMYTQLLEQMK